MKNKILFFIPLLIFISCSGNKEHSLPIKSLGLDITTTELIFEWEDAHSPRGEGYTLEVYSFKTNGDLKEKLKESQGYPIGNSLRKNWKISPWNADQLENKDVSELLFSYLIKNNKAKKEIDNLESIVNTGQYFVSYYYKGSDDYIDSVDLYLIDIKNNKLYRCIVIT